MTKQQHIASNPNHRNNNDIMYLLVCLGLYLLAVLFGKWLIIC